MLTSFRLHKAIPFLIALVIAALAPCIASADSGTVRLKVTKAGFIVGVGGVSAGTIGVAGADLVGTATNLHKPSDIGGVYSAASASVAVAGGGKVVTLQNSNGVVLTLRGRQVGFEASLSLSGMTLSVN